LAGAGLGKGGKCGSDSLLFHNCCKGLFFASFMLLTIDVVVNNRLLGVNDMMTAIAEQGTV